VAIGLASIAIVIVGGPDAAFWSGMAHMLIMPLQIVNGRLTASRLWTSAPPVDVRPMADGRHVDPAVRVVDPVHDPVVPPVGAVPAFELEAEGPPHPAWVGGQRAVDELDDRRGGLLRQAAQGPPWPGPSNGSRTAIRPRRSPLDLGQRLLLRQSRGPAAATSASASAMAATSPGSLFVPDPQPGILPA
jgi:hypothetical protein